MGKKDYSAKELEDFGQKCVDESKQGDFRESDQPKSPDSSYEESYTTDREKFFREIRKWQTGKMFSPR